MRLLMRVSIILLGLCLVGCAGGLPTTKMATAKAIQPTVANGGYSHRPPTARGGSQSCVVLDLGDDHPRFGSRSGWQL